MTIRIGGTTVIDDNKNGTFNMGNLEPYTSAQLDSKTGTVGQVVCCSDCVQKLVHWNGSRWIGQTNPLITGNTYSLVQGTYSEYSPSESPSDSMFHDGNPATGVTMSHDPEPIFEMTFSRQRNVSKILNGQTQLERVQDCKLGGIQYWNGSSWVELKDLMSPTLTPKPEGAAVLYRFPTISTNKLRFAGTGGTKFWPSMGFSELYVYTE